MQCTNGLILTLLLLLLHTAAAAATTTTAAVESDADRAKRGAVTIDFGLLLRNLLQKSADLSSVKVNLTRNIIAAKTTRRPAPPKATTTTTAAPPPPPPPPPPPARRRPRPHYPNGWWPRPYDYYPQQSFDYDYGDAAPPPPPPAPPATTAAPPPPPPPPAAPPAAVPRRVRPPPRPSGHYYDYDYDYGAAAPAAPRPRPQPAPAPAPPPAAPPAAAPPPPPPPRPRRPHPAQLGNQLIYQYAQPDDIYSKPRSYEGVTAAEDEAGAGTGAGAGAGDETAPIEDGNRDDDARQPANPSSPFLVNYPGEDYHKYGTLGQSLDTTKFNPFDFVAGEPGLNHFNVSPGLKQSSYYLQ